MPFPENVVKEAWTRSGGKCECKRTNHGHSGRCNRTLLYGSRGSETSYGWEAHHIVAEDSGGLNTLSNCEILCMDCHKKTRTYGR